MAIKYYPEPFRIKVVEPLRMLTRAEREQNRLHIKNHQDKSSHLKSAE